ncbi:MAG: hypothetical protein F4X65_14950 [Chloroflexi bacterium]|nr:hypothetical protein [Chloroflexota bacterium]
MLVTILRYIWRFLVDAGRRSEGQSDYPLRWNLIIIALLIAALNFGIIFLTHAAITGKNENQFIIGALIGLLPTGITALAGLGTTLMNEGRSNQNNQRGETQSN